ncbi:MAG: TonB-dependent receptor plug domain-containing protein, partial [Polyangiaceae bacterium]|nr:TonB-dependent receptor plug domain-containing protein [Polyangiaceae bacterium]
GDRVGADPMEVPASVAVIDRERLETEAITDFRSALERVPGVMPIFEYGGFQFLTVRGFSDFLVLHDGHRDDRSTIAMSAPQGGLYDVERIEVLRGPSSVLYGYGALGGVIDIVYRAPEAEAAYAGTLGIGSQGERRLRVGATGPTFHRSLLYRVDAGHSTRSDFRGLETRQDGVSVTLDYLPTPAHRLRVRAAVVDDAYSTDAGIPTLNGRIPDGVDRGTRYNTPQDFMRYRRYDVSVDYGYRIREHLELRNRFAFSRDSYEYLSTETLAVAANGNDVERGFFYLDRRWYPWSEQVELHAEVGGRVRQQIAVGYELGLLFSRHPRSDVFDTPVAPVALRNPGPDPQPEVPIAIVAKDTRDQRTHSLYAHDHVTLPGGVILV